MHLACMRLLCRGTPPPAPTATRAACHVASQRPFSGVSTSPAVPHTYFRSSRYRCFFASLLIPFKLSFTVFCSRRLLKFLRRQMTSSSKQSTQSSQVLRHLPDSPSMLAASLSHLPSSASFLWHSSRVKEGCATSQLCVRDCALLMTQCALTHAACCCLILQYARETCPNTHSHTSPCWHVASNKAAASAVRKMVASLTCSCWRCPGIWRQA